MYEILSDVPPTTKILAPTLLSPPNIRIQESPWPELVTSGPMPIEEDSNHVKLRKLVACITVKSAMFYWPSVRIISCRGIPMTNFAPDHIH